MLLRRFRKWLSRLLKREETLCVPEHAEVKVLRPGEPKPVFRADTESTADLGDLKARYRIIQRYEKPKKAVHADVSKHMKHGKQAPWYRKSVKAKVKPEVEEDGQT